MQLEIKKQAEELYSRVMLRYLNRKKWDNRSLSVMLNEELAGFNDKISKLLSDEVNSILLNKFDTNTLNVIEPNYITLSKRLHKNALEVASYVKKLFIDSSKTIPILSDFIRKLYDGYGHKELIQVKKKLPKYMQKYLTKHSTKKQIDRLVNKLKTKSLRTANKMIIKAVEEHNDRALRKAIKVSLEEKSRYYASRLALTETQRVKNLARGKEYLDDKEIEFVKYRMSSKHPMVDICDYYANLDVGYGKGIIPKKKMITLPLHPHCMCRYDPYYRNVKYSKPKPPLAGYTDNQKRQILGSYENVKKWEAGMSEEEIFNLNRKDYPIRLVVEVL